MAQLVDIDGGLVVLDASLEEQHSFDAELTSNPVEQGADVTDHLRRKPGDLTIRGFVTNAPVGPRRTERGATAEGASGYAQQAYRDLLLLLGAARAITVKTAWRTWEPVVLVSLKVPRTVDVGDAAEITLVFREIRFVATQTVQLPAQAARLRNTQKPGAAANQGKQTGEVAPPAQLRSAAKALGNWTGITTAGDGT